MVSQTRVAGIGVALLLFVTTSAATANTVQSFSPTYDAITTRSLLGASLGHFSNRSKYRPNHEMVRAFQTHISTYDAMTREALLHTLNAHFESWPEGRPSTKEIDAHLRCAEKALTAVNGAFHDGHISGKQKAALTPHLRALNGTLDSVTQHRIRVLIEKNGIACVKNRHKFGPAALNVLLDSRIKENADFAAMLLRKGRTWSESTIAALSVVAKRLDVLSGEENTAGVRREQKHYQKAIQKTLLKLHDKLHMSVNSIAGVPVETAQTLGRFATKKLQRGILRHLQAWNFDITSFGKSEHIAPWLHMALNFPDTAKTKQTFKHLLDTRTKNRPKPELDPADFGILFASLAELGVTIMPGWKVATHNLEVWESSFWAVTSGIGAWALAGVALFYYEFIVHEELKTPRLSLFYRLFPGEKQHLLVHKLFRRRPSHSDTRTAVQLTLVEGLEHLAARSDKGQQLIQYLAPEIEGVRRARQRDGLPPPQHIQALLPGDAAQHTLVPDHAVKNATVAIAKLVTLNLTHVEKQPELASKFEQVRQKTNRLTKSGALAHATPMDLSQLNRSIAELSQALEANAQFASLLQGRTETGQAQSKISDELGNLIVGILDDLNQRVDTIHTTATSAIKTKISTMNTARMQRMMKPVAPIGKAASPQ